MGNEEKLRSLLAEAGSRLGWYYDADLIPRIDAALAEPVRVPEAEARTVPQLMRELERALEAPVTAAFLRGAAAMREAAALACDLNAAKAGTEIAPLIRALPVAGDSGFAANPLLFDPAGDA